MSGWRTGRIRIACSIATLEKALLNIFPEWKGHIKVDPDGKIPFEDNERGITQYCHILIPPHKYTADTKWPNTYAVGLKRGANKEWVVYHRDYHGDASLLGEIKKEVATIEVKEKAIKRDATLIKEEETSDQRRLIFHIPVDAKYKFQA